MRAMLLILSLVMLSITLGASEVLTLDKVDRFIPLQSLERYGLDRDSVITHLNLLPNGTALFVAQRMHGKNAILFKLDLMRGEVKAINLKPIKRISKLATSTTGQEVLIYSYYHSTLAYLADDKMIRLDGQWLPFIPPDVNLWWAGRGAITIASLTHRRTGATDGKQYVILIAPSRKVIRRLISRDELERRAREACNDTSLKVSKVMGTGKTLLAFLIGTKATQLIKLDLRTRAVTCLTRYDKVVYFDFFKNRLALIGHTEGEPDSELILISSMGDKVSLLDRGKYLWLTLGNRFLGAITAEDDLVVFDARTLKKLRSFKLKLPRGHYQVLLTDSGYLVASDDKGFYMWRLRVSSGQIN